MTYTQLAYLHLATVVPAFAIGAFQLFRFLTLYSVPAAYFAIRRGNIRIHRANMIGLYVGGILIAGAFALSPGRMLHEWLFG